MGRLSMAARSTQDPYAVVSFSNTCRARPEGSAMNDSRKLVEALKRVVRMRGMTYATLAARARLSEATVKRLFSRGTFTLARLEQFCALLDIDFQELARLAAGGGDDTREMTLAQESALAADERLLAMFYLVYSGWRF